jgi:hypothetical protein
MCSKIFINVRFEVCQGGECQNYGLLGTLILRAEDTGSRFLQNIATDVPKSHPRRPKSLQ